MKWGDRGATMKESGVNPEVREEVTKRRGESGGPTRVNKVWSFERNNGEFLFSYVNFGLKFKLNF